MKKIIFMLKELHCGGVERALINLLDNVDKQKYSCELVCIRKKGEFVGELEKRIKVYEIDCDNYVKDYLIDETMPRLLSARNLKEVVSYCYLKFLHQANRIIKKVFKYNLMYRYALRKCHTMPQGYDYAVDYLGYGSFTTYYMSKVKAKEKKYSWIHEQRMTRAYDWNRKRYKYFDNIYAVGNDCAELFKGKFPQYKQKVGVVHNILNINDILKKAGMEVEDVPQNEFLIVSVGRLAEQKTFDKAINAAKILRDMNKTFFWLIVGDGPEQGKLQQLINEYSLNDIVKLYGYSDNPYPYIKACNLYVQTSKAEGYCTTITEATILGKAVVTTDVTGVYEQLDNGKGGIIVAKDEKKIAMAINELMGNNDKIRQYEQYNMNRNYNYRDENMGLFI